MKNLIITDNNIKVNEIIADFKGIIICYLKNCTKGYIVFENKQWCYCNTISLWKNYINPRNSLDSLLKDLISNDICNNFKVIEFDD